MPKKPGEIYEQARDSVVAIRTKNGEGSGVVVGDNEVVTNCHVIDDGSPILVGKVDPNGQWNPVRAQVVAADLRDLCLLRAEKLSSTPLSIGSAKELRVGDAVYALGAPSGLPLTFSGGFVSQLRGDIKLSPIIQTDAATSPGSSGGGLLNGEGQLVGITTMSKEGENLNFALPADWIKSLRNAAQVESPIRQRLTDCLHAGDKRAMPAVFREAAVEIARLHSSPARRASIFGRIARAEARAGNKDSALAKEIAESAMRPESLQDGDQINFQAAWCFARLGSFSQAAKVAEQIEGGEWRLLAYAVVSAEQALSGDTDAALENFGKIGDIGKLENRAALWLLAWAFAEMGQVKEALECAEEAQQPGDFVGGVRALSSIAGALVRHQCGLGAAALFDFARKQLQEENYFLGAGERVLSLGYIAWDQAACELGEEAWESMQLAMKIVAEGEIENEEYHMKIEALAHIAETAAKIGNVAVSARAISRIPVLSGDLAVALAYVAIAIEQGA